MKTLMILSFLLTIIIELCNAQNYTFKCDGIYQTCQNGIKIKNELKHISRDSCIALARAEGAEIKQIFGDPDFFIIDTIPVVCFSDIKSAKIQFEELNKKSVLVITLKDNEKDKFKDVSVKNIGKNLPIIFENKLISDPVMNDIIENGKMDLSGLDNEMMEKIIRKVNK